MIKSPSCGSLNISKTALLSSLSGPIRRMCPSHCSLLALIHFTRSNVCSPFFDSWCTVLPVIIDSIVAFAPFIALHTSAVSGSGSSGGLRVGGSGSSGGLRVGGSGISGGLRVGGSGISGGLLISGGGGGGSVVVGGVGRCSGVGPDVLRVFRALLTSDR